MSTPSSPTPSGLTASGTALPTGQPAARRRSTQARRLRKIQVGLGAGVALVALAVGGVYLTARCRTRSNAKDELATAKAQTVDAAGRAGAVRRRARRRSRRSTRPSPRGRPP